MISKLKYLMAVCCLVLPCTAIAQISIVATVDGKPITNYEVEQRLLFLEYATNIAITDANRDRLTNDALQLLIDDTLKITAAENEASDIASMLLPKVRDLINQNFGDSGMSGTRVLTEAGIDPATVQMKYLGDLAWSSYISSKFASRFEKVQNKVDDELERIRVNASKPQLQIGEIILVPSPTRTVEQTVNLASEMVAAVRKGANFAEIARQYSASGSASQGGDVGWLVVEKLPPVFRDALMAIQNGDVTEPVVVDGAVYVFRRISERKDGLVDDSQTRLWLARAILPLSTDASEADRLETAARIRRDTEELRGCDKIAALNDSYGSGIRSRLDDVIIADLAPQMRQLLSSLEQGVPSEPLAFAEGIASLMVCRIETPQLALPSRDEVRQTLVERAFGSLAERQLLRQRRKAIIDYIGQS